MCAMRSSAASGDNAGASGRSMMPGDYDLTEVQEGG
jgi:hypothetical protein